MVKKACQQLPPAYLDVAKIQEPGRGAFAACSELPSVPAKENPENAAKILLTPVVSTATNSIIKRMHAKASDIIAAAQEPHVTNIGTKPATLAQRTKSCLLNH